MARAWATGMGAVAVVMAGQLLTPAPAGAQVDVPLVEVAEPLGGTPGDITESPLAVPGVGNVAHKGASVHAPENTMAAVREAIAQQANFVGIDVHRTRDSRLVVLHDPRLARTTNAETVFPRRAPWSVNRFTLAEIRRLDAGKWMSPTYTHERVPTLSQVLDELNTSSTGLFLEVKEPQSYGGVDGIGDQVVRALRQHTTWLDPGGPQDRLVVQAFNDGFLKAFEARYDDVVVGTLGAAANLSGYATWADQINVHYNAVTPSLVDSAHAAGLAVSTFVVNQPDRMRAVVTAGVDAISTDRPQVLHTVLSGLDRVMRDPGAEPAPAEPASAALALSAPARALLDTRVPLRAVVRGADGRAARWTRVRVQLRNARGWRTLQRRVTDRDGVLHTTVSSRHRLRLRVASEPTEWHRAAEPVVRSVETRRARTHVRLFGERRVGARATRLSVRWRAEDGRRVSGRPRLWAKPAGRGWRRVAVTAVRDGVGHFRVRPGRDTRFQVRAPGGSWWTGDRDGHYVDVVRRRRQ